MDGRLIVDSAASGSWNMAVDEALLNTASEKGIWTLRFYQWSEPTLSLGYFQKWQDRDTHAPSRECVGLRRSTGGGAIMHHHDLTYSITCPNKDRLSGQNEELYFLVHRAIQIALAEQGITVHLNGIDSRAENENPALPAEPFLCFLRRAKGDIVLGKHKICGSAQRRWRGGLLQHGSIILETSEFAPKIDGIGKLAHDLQTDPLIEIAHEIIASDLKINLKPAELTQSEIENAKKIMSEKYQRNSWNQRR